MEELPYDFRGKEITVHCIVIYATLEDRRIPCLEEGEVLSVERKTNRNNAGEWTIVVQKVMKRADIFRGIPGPKVITRLFFPERIVVQDETAPAFWKRIYGGLSEPLRQEEILAAARQYTRLAAD